MPGQQQMTRRGGTERAGERAAGIDAAAGRRTAAPPAALARRAAARCRCQCSESSSSSLLLPMPRSPVAATCCMRARSASSSTLTAALDSAACGEHSSAFFDVMILKAVAGRRACSFTPRLAGRCRRRGSTPEDLSVVLWPRPHGPAWPPSSRRSGPQPHCPPEPRSKRGPHGTSSRRVDVPSVDCVSTRAQCGLVQ